MQNKNTSVLNLRPSSCSSYWVNLGLLAVFFALQYILPLFWPRLTSTDLTGWCLLAMVVPLIVYELRVLKVHSRDTTGLREPSQGHDAKRVLVKLCGLFGTFLLILCVYFFVPFYRSEFYAPFFYYLGLLSPAILMLCWFYFWVVDRRQVDPYDGYWHAGCLVTGRIKAVNWVILREHAQVWFIKAFFAPIMMGILVKNVSELRGFEWQVGPQFFFSSYSFLLIVFYSMDVIYGLLGYVLTCRVLDNHIRSTEPTLLGWVVCLACYDPFAKIAGMDLLSEPNSLSWAEWLAAFPVSYYVVGGVIILLSLIYALATVALGYRMSNLTYRGIITSGPYRFTKHPAYLSKVASWWLISLPFFSVSGPAVAIKQTLGLAFITVIYYLRARTEENHLSNYPEYVAYAQWINRNGMIRSITRYFPFWQYSLEKCQRWNSVVWFKKLQ